MAEGHIFLCPDYKQDTNDVLFNLQRGFEHLSAFVKDLQFDVSKHCNDPDYIRIKLMPNVSQAMNYFVKMKDTADELNQKVSNAVEDSLIDMKKKNEERKEINKKMEQLKAELKQMDENLKDAEKTLQSKKSQLASAKSALSSARQKLDDAKSSQDAAVFGGLATTVISVLLTPLVPPLGVAGAAGGVGSMTAGLTVFETAVQEQSNRVDTVRNEKAASESSFNTAKTNKQKLEDKMQTFCKQRAVLKNDIQNKEKEIKDTKEMQIKTIELNERIKKTYIDLCIFHGRVKVLFLETSGGYSLAALQTPTLAVCESVTLLIRSPDCITLFGQYGIDNVKRTLGQIEGAKWTVDEDDLSDLI